MWVLSTTQSLAIGLLHCECYTQVFGRDNAVVYSCDLTHFPSSSRRDFSLSRGSSPCVGHCCCGCSSASWLLLSFPCVDRPLSSPSVEYCCCETSSSAAGWLSSSCRGRRSSSRSLALLLKSLCLGTLNRAAKNVRRGAGIIIVSHDAFKSVQSQKLSCRPKSASRSTSLNLVPAYLTMSWFFSLMAKSVALMSDEKKMSDSYCWERLWPILHSD